jgi:hypothetical protein
VMVAAFLLGGCVPEAAGDGALPDFPAPSEDATGDEPSEADEIDVAADAGDEEFEARADDAGAPDDGPAGEADVDTGGDADADLPGPDASCLELSDWILEYSRTHGACTSADECVAATSVYWTGGCRACYFLNADLVDGRMYSPALRADAVTSEFTSVRERFWTECAMSMRAPAWHWSCIYDGVVDHVEIDCVASRCVANPVHGPCDPWLDGGTK